MSNFPGSHSPSDHTAASRREIIVVAAAAGATALAGSAQGCIEAQGYFFSRPCRASDLQAIIARRYRSAA